MAQKRMFSLQIVDTDAFLDMPISSQVLYFHLVMRADDEGFVSNPKKIMRLVGTQEDDMKILIGKRFILTFDSGVVVIKHWLIHNTIRLDRFNKTTYQRERNQISISDNKAYTEMATVGLPDGNRRVTQVKLSKVKLSKKIPATEVAAPPPKKKPETKKDDQSQSLEEYLELMRASPQKHINVIGEYADQIKPDFKTVGQWRVFTKRNLRAANDLSVYSQDQIEKAFAKLEKDIKSDKNRSGFITRWTLETLLGYVTK